LTGFMGAGKSTVGACLAEILGWRFLDLDSVIESSCAQTVPEIFRQHGESYFRARERQELQRLSGEKRVVLALGGGSIEDQLVLASLLKWEEACMVFLDAPLPELLARIGGEAETRPLVTTPEALYMRHQRRLPLYRSAHLTVVTTGLAPREVALRVIERVSLQWLLEGVGPRDGEDGNARKRGQSA
jgi:shikimate kinase